MPALQTPLVTSAHFAFGLAFFFIFGFAFGGVIVVGV
jgi:hypothetical protein